MKLRLIKELASSNKDENDTLRDTPPSGDMGQFITTAQAAKILGVTQSRVRQFIMDGRLTAHHPVKGRRDNFLKKADVDSFANEERERTGRPDEGKGTSPDKKDDK